MSWSAARVVMPRPCSLRPLQAVFPVAGPSRLQGRLASTATAAPVSHDNESHEDRYREPAHHSTAQGMHRLPLHPPELPSASFMSSTPTAPVAAPPSAHLSGRSRPLPPPAAVSVEGIRLPPRHSEKGTMREQKEPLEETAQKQEVRLVRTLMANTDLTEYDARQELGWLRQHVWSSREGRQRNLNPAAGIDRISTGAQRIDEQQESTATGSTSSTDKLEDLVRRRGAGEPLQYILGTAHFGPLELRVRAPVLIPREETAHIFSRFKYKSSGMRVCDLCCGSGAIALLLAHLNPEMHVVGFDVNPQAVELATENAKLLGLDGRVRFVQLDLYAPDAASTLRKYADPSAFPDVRLTGGKSGTEVGYDLVVSNPPYVTPAEYEDLSPSVKLYEDRLALVGTPPKWYADAHPRMPTCGRRQKRRGLPTSTRASRTAGHDERATADMDARGLSFYARIAELAPRILRSSPKTPSDQGGDKYIVRRAGSRRRRPARIAVEIGAGQAKAVKEIVRRMKGISSAHDSTDQYGRPRLVLGRG